jgi:hypothetical protein
MVKNVITFLAVKTVSSNLNFDKHLSDRVVFKSQLATTVTLYLATNPETTFATAGAKRDFRRIFHPDRKP